MSKRGPRFEVGNLVKFEFDFEEPGEHQTYQFDSFDYISVL